MATPASPPPKPPHKNLNVILISTFVAFGGFLFGYDTGLISGILEMDTFQAQFSTGTNENLTTSEKSLVVSMLSVGTFIGAIVSGWAADRFGRKWAMIWSTVVFAVGVAIQTGCSTVPVLTFGRVIAGLGVGLLSDLVPLYHSEVAPKEIRYVFRKSTRSFQMSCPSITTQQMSRQFLSGSLVATYQLTITIGLLLAFVVNQITQGLTNSAAYRIPIGLQLLWALVLGGGCYFCPDSPRGLMREGRNEEAVAALRILYGVKDGDTYGEERVQEEISEIKAGLLHESQILTSTSYSTLWKQPLLRRTLIGINLQMFQQLTGINFIMYYGTTFFKSAGLEGFMTQTITGVVMVLFTLPGMWMIDKWGRRILMIIGCGVMFLGMMVVGVMGEALPITKDAAGNVVSSSPTAGIIITVFSCVFIAGFAAAWGPGAWVVPSEIFPLPVRAKGISMATASNWLWNFILGFITPYLTDDQYAALGTKIAFVWAVCTFVGAGYVYFFVPETKGLMLEDVDEMFESGVSARQSVGWRKTRRDFGVEGGMVDDMDVVHKFEMEKPHVV
ncbi:hypothetical protein HK097_009456 [Rhizophlyctis rosea]|uniref:Major facilitator superfamily (MFS) profile domain-containing protein n=1 Tax=Rhizophlyctis rosea TaxID=64517 RepID=A0AAD5X0F2_9FUNG|nr:hypothetical protein HK097_009456 [Rhizophlyctis rosea]